MGYGDEIMVSSIARRMYAMTNQRVTILDRMLEVRKSEVWGGLNFISQEQPNVMTELRSFIINGPSARQYYSGMEGSRILWRKWDIAPGEIRLTDEERAWASLQVTSDFLQGRPFVVFNPDYKPAGGGGSNKDWGLRKWAAVCRAFWGKICFVRCDPNAANWDDTISDGIIRDIAHDGGLGSYAIVTPTFRHACAILERSIGYVGHEGGLHHAAAALGKPAVVVFGGFISPEVTGYQRHTNLYVPDERYPLGCGDTAPCNHCRAAMEKITVEQVVNAVKEMVNVSL